MLPGEAGYEERRSIWNRMIDRRPALFARCASTEDARRALAFARERDLPISIMGGGHNVSGSALVDDGVVIDHGLRRGVHLSADRSRVSVEPGALLGDLDAATVPQRVAVPIGINTTTGLAGLTLGGGIGWLMRAHGLTCDRLVGAEAILADGSLAEVDEATDPDLLWALRGGGGNFGIVTRFEFATVPVPEAVLAGMLAFPMEDAVRILRAYRDWAAESPENSPPSSRCARSCRCRSCRPRRTGAAWWASASASSAIRSMMTRCWRRCAPLARRCTTPSRASPSPCTSRCSTPASRRGTATTGSRTTWPG